MDTDTSAQNHQKEPPDRDSTLLVELLRVVSASAPMLCESPDTGLTISIVSGLFAAAITWWGSSR